MEAVSQNAWEGLNKELDLEKLAEPTFPIIFATFPTLINIPHLRLKHSLEKSRFRIGWSKKLNGVVFTIFIPFSFSAISLYETHTGDDVRWGFFHNLFVRLYNLFVTCTRVVSSAPQRAPCVRVQPWYGVRIQGCASHSWQDPPGLRKLPEK